MYEEAVELLTGLLNISLLEWAAMPPAMTGALERRAVTPLTLSLSEKVAICVSAVLWTSRAVGGAMTSSLVGFLVEDAERVVDGCFESGRMEGIYGVAECLRYQIKSIYQT